MANHIRLDGDSLGPCTVKEIHEKTLRQPLFDISVREAGSLLVDALTGTVRSQGSGFLLELLVVGQEAVFSGMGPKKQQYGEHAVEYVPEMVPIGTLQTQESNGYWISGKLLDGSAFTAETLDFRMNSHVDGRALWTSELSSFEVFRDDRLKHEHLNSILAAKGVPVQPVPKGISARTHLILRGTLPISVPTTFDLDQDLAGKRIELLRLRDNLTLVTLSEKSTSANFEEHQRLLEIVHEGLCFACGSYYHILGFSAEAGLQTGLKVWHRATHEVPISGHSPIPENPKDVENLLRRYIGFYARPLTTAEDDDCTDSLRALILRQLMAGEEYYPIQEFILCTSIEGFVSIAEPALDDGREKDLKFLKKQLKEFLAIQPEVSDDTCSEGRRVNIERLKSYIGSMGFRTTRGLMEAFFSEAGLVWNDAYGRAWSRIRNPSAHGTQVSLDQSRVTNFLISIELWNLLILGLIGYDGEVRRYGATGCFGSFPSSPIKNLPDHLLVPSVPSKKGTKQPKGRFF